MAKADKVATVAEIADRFRNSSAAVVTEYRGLTMAQLTTLRKSLGADTAYTVAKNTLVKRAAADAGVAGLDEWFSGPTAVAFIAGEPVDAAKVLRDFAKTNPLLVIKGGILDGRTINADEVGKLADLESRDVLLAKMAGAMLATLTKAAVVLNALPSQVARLAAALLEKRTATEGAPEVPSIEAADDAAESADDAPAASDQSATPESATPESATPESVNPESVTPEVATSEVATAEVATAEVATPEVATPEVATPEVATAEVATPEVVDTPEVAAPESAAVAPAEQGTPSTDEAPAAEALADEALAHRPSADEAEQVPTPDA